MPKIIEFFLNFQDKEVSRREIDKLKEELIETKKESKKRRKMLETQQRMLMAQNSNYHAVILIDCIFLKIFLLFDISTILVPCLYSCILKLHLSRGTHESSSSRLPSSSKS